MFFSFWAQRYQILWAMFLTLAVIISGYFTFAVALPYTWLVFGSHDRLGAQLIQLVLIIVGPWMVAFVSTCLLAKLTRDTGDGDVRRQYRHTARKWINGKRDTPLAPCMYCRIDYAWTAESLAS